MNIIKRELRAHLKSFLIWSVCIFLFIVAMVSEFSAYYNNPEMADVINMMPQEVLDAFAISSGNLTTVSGFISIAAVYFFLLVGIYGALIGSSIISKEERDKTVEFFMTLPVSREKIIFSKLVAATILCLGIDLVTIGSLYMTTLQYDKLDYFNEYMWWMGLGMFIVEMVFMTFGMLLAAVMKRYKRSGSYSISALMIMFFLSILIGFSDKLQNLKYITPFKYFEASTILNELNLDLTYVLISIGIIVVSLSITFIVYPRRDLHI